MEKTMITSLSWIGKGYARSNPIEYDLKQQEMEEMKKDPLIQEELAKQNKKDVLDLEYYDNESSLPVFSSEVEKMKLDKEPNDDYPMGFEDVSDDEKEDFTIQKDDILIVAAKIEDEFSSLEIYIYEETKYNLYVHHEITLSAFPLCLEWLPIDFSSYTEESCKKGNYVIVGSFLPEIEIWDLDVVNAIEPSALLGGELEQNKKKSKKFTKKKGNYKKGSHEDAVISLSLNKFRKNLLCSGSADTTVKLWDLTNQTCMHTYNFHENKVQVVKWNPAEEPILFTAGFDKKLNLLDVRQPNTMAFDLKSDIESGVWDPQNPMNIVFSTEDGFISQLDARNFNSGYVFHTRGHEKSITSVSMNSKINGMLATVSLDGRMKVWDCTQINENSPKLIANKPAKAGKLYCGSFCDDNPWVLGCGSSTSDLVIWDTSEDNNIKLNFEGRFQQITKEKKKKEKKEKKEMELEEIKE